MQNLQKLRKNPSTSRRSRCRILCLEAQKKNKKDCSGSENATSKPTQAYVQCGSPPPHPTPPEGANAPARQVGVHIPASPGPHAPWATAAPALQPPPLPPYTTHWAHSCRRYSLLLWGGPEGGCPSCTTTCALRAGGGELWKGRARPASVLALVAAARLAERASAHTSTQAPSTHRTHAVATAAQALLSPPSQFETHLAHALSPVLNRVLCSRSRFSTHLAHAPAAVQVLHSLLHGLDAHKARGVDHYLAGTRGRQGPLASNGPPAHDSQPHEQ